MNYTRLQTASCLQDNHIKLNLNKIRLKSQFFLKNQDFSGTHTGLISVLLSFKYLTGTLQVQ